jgi:hypothetical protein
LKKLQSFHKITLAKNIGEVFEEDKIQRRKTVARFRSFPVNWLGHRKFTRRVEQQPAVKILHIMDQHTNFFDEK